MSLFRRKARATSAAPPGSPVPAPADLQAVGSRLVAAFESASTDGDGRIRVEDLLSAAAAVCGEACIAAAGEFDPEDHAFTPGGPVLSDRVNRILVADATDWAGAGSSVFGSIRSGALAQQYAETDFPPIDAPIRQYVATLGAGDPEATWGRVSLSVPEANRPRIQPLRQAYELRGPVRRILSDGRVPRTDWPIACAAALVVELGRVRQAIDPAIAIRIVLETVNGMAKMAPMTDRHMREGSAG
jgi:hypothetical protein